MTSYRTHSASSAETNKAVCADCRHCYYVDAPASNPDHELDNWVCMSSPWEVIRPAGRHPVTGERVSELSKPVYCMKKNAEGTCPDFERNAALQVLEPKRGLLRKLALRLGAWLVSKA